ncbi:aminotransferase-like domain-containing protein [Saccharibacillus alkalitolerans]|uniref:PLP-dependent aminotransferase family protein n=1 Tax=Saccharibacillus alkalitolerans TaxID=2705290 RepID=A0ABX0F9N8_9BACL|nr:PLP-dependent aminotransferase family protein [Saccharibacillus alkalitolerans]NGZ76689.1 PLP-dependent aminotransferase family protein [Saccharibacillus alkalitolerans]
MYKYMELLNELESMIGGSLKEGDKMPSIRVLSDRYSCSKSTVIRALSELERTHLIYASAKSGYYVLGGTERRETRGETIDFVRSAPDPGIFPYLDFQHCLNKAIDTYRNDLFIYGTPQGLPSLIREMQRHLTDYQVFAEPDRIFITSGVQQALTLLAGMPFPDGKRTVLLEQPGYPLCAAYLEEHRIPAIGIRRDADGVDLDELETLFRGGGIKFFYTIPRFHNPLGASYSRRHKEAIAELAARYGVYVVEDDYMSDLERDAKSDPIYAYDRADRTVYLKSYSKIVFPGLRVAAAVLPLELTESFRRHKQLLDIDSSMLSQAALELYLKSGMFDRHREKIRRCYGRRSELLSEAIREALHAYPGAFAGPPPAEGGIHTHLLPAAPAALSSAIDRLRRRGIVAESANSHYLRGFRTEAMLKLNVSGVREDDIPVGVSAVAEELAQAVRRTRPPSRI